MVVEVYDEKAKKYEVKDMDIFQVPVSYDMDRLIQCPHCKRQFPFGDGYSSRNYFFKGGVFALYVCPECHDKEWGRENGEKIFCKIVD